MNWLILVAATVILDSLRIFIDNYTSDTYFKSTGAVSQKLFYAYAYIAVAFLAIVFLWGELSNIPTVDIIILIISGIISSISGIFYYKVLEIDDSNNLAIFIQLAPILYLIYDWCTGAKFVPLQLVAFVIILLAPFLVIFSSRKNARKTKIKAVILSFLYVLVAVIGNLFFVGVNSTDFNFGLVIAFIFLGKGLGNLIIIYSRPKLRRRYWAVFHKSHGKVLKPLILNSAIGFTKDFTYRASLVAAPTVALASVVSDSSEPIVVFLLGIVLTLIYPKFGREKLDRKNVLVHLVATIFVVIGIILIQVA